MRRRVLITFTLVIFASYGVLADVRTEQRTQVQFAGMLGRVVNLFGGKGAREGVTSTVLVKGDRKVTATDSTSQIVDLSEEKVYDLDLRRRTYKVTTFAEMRRQMEEAQRRAAEDARKDQGRSEPQEPSQGEQKEVEIDFDLKNTGETKALNGFNTRQAIMTITVREKGKTLEESGGLVLTSDMWLAPDQPAMQEVADFDRRYAEKLYGGLSGVSADQMAMVMAMYPMLREGIQKMSAEGGKLEGTAIQTTLTFDAVPAGAQAKGEAKEEAQPAATGRGIGGMLGGLARRARKTNEDEPKQRTTFMTTTVEVLKLSTDVSADEVAIPATFKEVK